MVAPARQPSQTPDSGQDKRLMAATKLVRILKEMRLNPEESAVAIIDVLAGMVVTQAEMTGESPHRLTRQVAANFIRTCDALAEGHEEHE